MEMLIYIENIQFYIIQLLHGVASAPSWQVSGLIENDEKRNTELFSDKYFLQIFFIWNKCTHNRQDQVSNRNEYKSFLSRIFMFRDSFWYDCPYTLWNIISIAWPFDIISLCKIINMTRSKSILQFNIWQDKENRMDTVHYLSSCHGNLFAWNDIILRNVEFQLSILA